MQRILILVLLLGTACGGSASGQAFPDFLQGTWKREGREIYEHWDLLNPGTMRGLSYQVSNGKMKVSEYLEISLRERDLYYTATVVGQNKGQGVTFKLARADSVLSFENPAHDFPKIIRYQLLDSNRMSVFVGTASQGFRFFFRRVEEKPAALPAPAVSRVDTLPSGELILEQEILVGAPLEEAWKAFTTEEAWKQWVTPVVEMDFRVNGTIRSHYNPEAKIGDEGTITNHILNYLPHKQITMQAEIAANFPDFVREEEKNLYSVTEFEAVGPALTRVKMYGIGYKNEARWLELMEFFIRGNEMSLNKLKQFLEQ